MIILKHICSLLIILSTALPSMAASKSIRLNQTHVFYGANEITAAPEGIRIENLGRLKFVLVAKSPKWQVSIFRNDDKTYITQSLESFENTGIASGVILDKTNRNFTKKSLTSTFNFSGQKLVRMTASDKTLKYMPLNGLPPQIERILYAFYALPTNGGITTGFARTLSGKDYLSGKSVKGLMEVSLTTENIKSVPTDGKLFKVPAGYRLAKSTREVVTGDATRKSDADYQALFGP